MITTGSDKPAPPNSDTLSPVLCDVIAMPVRFTSAVSSATASTATYLASNSPTRGTGAAINISSVPRSRSPAVRSIAGYTAPVTVISTRISGIKAASEKTGAPLKSSACRWLVAGNSAATPSVLELLVELRLAERLQPSLDVTQRRLAGRRAGAIVQFPRQRPPQAVVVAAVVVIGPHGLSGHDRQVDGGIDHAPLRGLGRQFNPQYLRVQLVFTRGRFRLENGRPSEPFGSIATHVFRMFVAQDGLAPASCRASCRNECLESTPITYSTSRGWTAT